MREKFFSALYNIAKRDGRVILLTSDTGAIILDKFRKNLPRQCINIGIAEQNMIGVAAGMAMGGKIVYVYAIVPFVTLRCFEQVRVDVCCQNLPVKLIGIGSGLDYSTLGPTHHGLEDIAVMRSLPGMTILSPCDENLAGICASISYQVHGPVYIRIDRSGKPLVYRNTNRDFSEGLNIIKPGGDLFIIATGNMVFIARKVAQELSKHSIEAGVLDLYRIKPLNIKALLKIIKKVNYVVTLEEHSVIGGLGSAISEILAQRLNSPVVKRLGLPDRFCRQYGTRNYLQGLNDLDIASIINTICKMIGK